MPSAAQVISKLVDLFTLDSNNFASSYGCGNRNGFVDGMFDSWQLYTSPVALTPTANAYVADMWASGVGAGGAGTVSLQQHAIGDNPANCYRAPVNFLRHAQTTASTANPITYQHLENPARYAGKSVTVSFCLKAAAPITVPAVAWQRNWGTGGSPSAAEGVTTAVQWAVGTTWKRFSVRLDIPSAVGKVQGTTTTGYFGITLYHPSGTTYTLDQSSFQIEVCSPNASSDTTGVGGSPTLYDYAGEQNELIKVWRYVQRVQFNASMYGGAGAVQFGVVSLLTPMRSVPVVGQLSAGSASNCTFSSVGATNFILQANWTITAAGAASATNYYYYTDCRL